MNLTTRAARALDLAMELTEDNQTDVMNRALQVYSYLLYATETRKAVITVKEGDEPAERLNLLL
jgi:hypothetical protein